MQNYTLKDYYKRIRANGASAIRAITMARENLATNRPLYDIPARPTITYNPQSESGGRWIENASAGMRRVGYADQIATRMNSRGWYIDDIESEVYRGVVYQLPAHKGKEVFAYGYADPYNDDCAFLVFDTAYTDKIDAAYAADHVAEKHAEREREYNEAYHAGNQYALAQSDIKTERRAALALLAAMRIERNRGAAQVICDALRGQVNRHLQAISEARATRAKLWDDYSHLREPRNQWRAHLWDAFNEGSLAA